MSYESMRALNADLTAALDALDHPTEPPPNPQPPVNIELPAISGIVAVGSTLTCSAGRWANVPASYAYRWFRDSTPLGVNANAYAIVAADEGHSLRCEVTASNSAGASTVTSAPTEQVPATPPPPPPPPVGTVFRAVPGGILDPAGQPWVGRGANVLGGHMFWPNYDTNGMVLDQFPVWGWNFARINNAGPGGAPNAEWGRNDWTGVTVDDVIGAYTSNGVTVFASLNATESGQWPGEGSEADGVLSLAAVKAWCVQVATAHRDNPRVWIEPLNESGDDYDVDHWFNVYNEIVQAIRGTGFPNPIVVCGNWWGQDNQQYSTNHVPDSDSSILSRGAALLAADPLHNIIFDLHCYDIWGFGGVAGNAAKLIDYLDRAAAKGLSVLIGEFGGYSNGANPYLDTAARAVIQVAGQRALTTCWWHAQPGDGFALTWDGPLDARPLSPLGELYWDLSH